MRGLNRYSGLGGNRKKWENCKVTSVESNEKIANVYSRLYPQDELIVADAHQFLLENYSDFDFIWSSPPCQSHSRMNKATRHKIRRYPSMDLYQQIIFLDNFFEGDWVVENVQPYYTPLIPATKIGRHLFWSNFSIFANDIERPKGFINKSNLEGKRELMDWLDIHFEENIYYENNHCPAQILRNCVHPDLGLQVFECSLFDSGNQLDLLEASA